MNIELTPEQVQSILAKASAKVETEAVELLRAEVKRNLAQWTAEVKNAARGAVADAATKQVLARLDVTGCVDKAMENLNTRIQREVSARIKNGIAVTFQATVANPAE